MCNTLYEVKHPVRSAQTNSHMYLTAFERSVLNEQRLNRNQAKELHAFVGFERSHVEALLPNRVGRAHMELPTEENILDSGLIAQPRSMSSISSPESSRGIGFRMVAHLKR